MRDYGKVYTQFWTSDDTRGLSDDSKLLALYLMTTPHSNMLGCFRLPTVYAADDLQWVDSENNPDMQRVSKGFAELSEKGFIYRCQRSQYVLICNFLKWNQFENPNVGKSAGKLFESLGAPDALKAKLLAALRDFAPYFPSEIFEKYKTLLEPFANPSDTSPETRATTGATTTTGTPAGTPTEPELSAGAADAAPGGDDDHDEKKTGAIVETGKKPAKSDAVWQAYCLAYELRYGVTPLRDAQSNTLICKFIDTIGTEDAPQVARYYVEHNERRFIQERHPITLMHLHRTKLYTDWKLGQQMTDTTARQAEQKQSLSTTFHDLDRKYAHEG